MATTVRYLGGAAAIRTELAKLDARERAISRRRHDLHEQIDRLYLSSPLSEMEIARLNRLEESERKVSLDRPEPAFSGLRHARRRGFVLIGTGRANVRTPPVYPPGARALVTTAGGDGRSSENLRVGPDGALRIAVQLGRDTPATTRVAIRLSPG